MASSRQSRNRKANFASGEVFLLLEEISLEKIIIASKLSNAVTVQRKRQVWEAIVGRLNSQFGHQRTIDEVKKKFKDVKATVQKQLDDNKKTGGGRGGPPSIYTDQILAIIGTNSAVLDGINVGGMDSYSPAQSPCLGSQDLFSQDASASPVIHETSTLCNPIDEVEDCDVTLVPMLQVSMGESMPQLQPQLASTPLSFTFPSTSQHQHNSTQLPHISPRLPHISSLSTIMPHTSTPLPRLATPPPSTQPPQPTLAAYCLADRLRAARKRPNRQQPEDPLLDKWLQSDIEKNASITRANESLINFHNVQIEYMRFQMNLENGSK